MTSSHVGTKLRVTDHAVMRWCERVHKLEAYIDDVAGRGADDLERATVGCAFFGISVREARHRILPHQLFQRVRFGLSLGAQAIILDDCKLIVTGDAIVTVKVAGMSFCRPAKGTRRHCYRAISSDRSSRRNNWNVTDVCHFEEAA